MDCQWARLPGGCGNSVHCASCGIRDCVMRTFETGQPVKERQVYLDHDSGRMALTISTEKRSDVVIISVHSMSPAQENVPSL